MTLRICPENPRYFCDAAGRAVYLTGSHTWNCLQDLGEPFDYPRFLDRLVELDHNFVRLWVFEQACGLQWAQRQREAVVEPALFERTGPGLANDGRPRFDLTRVNPAYLQLQHARVAAAAERGIYVSVMLFMGFSVTNCDPTGVPWRFHPFHRDNNVNGIDGDPSRREDGALTHTLELPGVTRLQDGYVRRVVEQLNAFDNVLFEVSNESPPASTAFQAHVIDHVRELERGLPKQHPIGMTFQWEGGENRTLFESAADWVSPNAAGGFDVDPPSAACGKVVISDTDHLWGVGGSVEWVWKTFCRGHHPIFMDPWDEQLYTVNTWRGPIDPEPIRRAMGQTLRVARDLDLRNTLPRPELASSGYCLADDGRAYVVFDLGAERVELRVPAGTYRLRWLDPCSGEVLGVDTETAQARLSLIAPARGPIVLVAFADR